MIGQKLSVCLSVCLSVNLGDRNHNCLLSKIRDRDWSYTRHVICINNQCCPCINIPG